VWPLPPTLQLALILIHFSIPPTHTPFQLAVKFPATVETHASGIHAARSASCRARDGISDCLEFTEHCRLLSIGPAFHSLCLLERVFVVEAHQASRGRSPRLAGSAPRRVAGSGPPACVAQTPRRPEPGGPDPCVAQTLRRPDPASPRPCVAQTLRRPGSGLRRPGSAASPRPWQCPFRWAGPTLLLSAPPRRRPGPRSSNSVPTCTLVGQCTHPAAEPTASTLHPTPPNILGGHACSMLTQRWSSRLSQDRPPPT
jgi:hypothetical protein